MYCDRICGPTNVPVNALCRCYRPGFTDDGCTAEVVFIVLQWQLKLMIENKLMKLLRFSCFYQEIIKIHRPVVRNSWAEGGGGQIRRKGVQNSWYVAFRYFSAIFLKNQIETITRTKSVN
jgi:hypothetical protein